MRKAQPKEMIKQSLLRIDAALRRAADNVCVQEDEAVLAKIEYDMRCAEAYLMLAAEHSSKTPEYVVANPSATESPGAKAYPRIAVGTREDEVEQGQVCKCGAKFGETHKIGCDMEICPICGQQLKACNCWLGMY